MCSTYCGGEGQGQGDGDCGGVGSGRDEDGGEDGKVNGSRAGPENDGKSAHTRDRDNGSLLGHYTAHYTRLEGER